MSEVEVLKLYCMDCREWVYDRDSHEYQIEHWVVADELMIGIADKVIRARYYAYDGSMDFDRARTRV